MMTTWEAIFPTPVLRANLGRAFTEKEVKFFGESERNVCENQLNMRSVNTRVLESPQLREVHSFIAEHVNLFGRKIISTNDRVKFYVTQSWLNYTRTGQAHHRHSHSNSLVSGVFYVSAVKEIDRLYFYRSPTSSINVGQREQNWYTADSWFFSVATGDLILFPSYVTHGVEEATGTHLRVSLAFNTFVRGAIGEDELLNSLDLS